MAFDLTGHGKSQVSIDEIDYQLDMLVDTTLSIIKHYKLDTPILVCHSYGSLIGSRLCKKIKVAALICIAPKTQISNHDLETGAKIANLPMWILLCLRWIDKFGGPWSMSVRRILGPKPTYENRVKQLAFNTTTPTIVVKNMLHGVFSI